MLHLKFSPPEQCSKMLFHTSQGSPAYDFKSRRTLGHAGVQALSVLAAYKYAKSEWSSNLGHAGGGVQEGTGSRGLAGVEAAAEDTGMVACALRGGTGAKAQLLHRRQPSRRAPSCRTASRSRSACSLERPRSPLRSLCKSQLLIMVPENLVPRLN